MNYRVLLRAVSLLAVACTCACTKNTYDPTQVPAQSWFQDQRKSKRQPNVAKPREQSYSGRVHHAVLDRASSGNTTVVIDIGAQKGYLLVNGEIALESPVSTAKPGKYTPRGSFTMTERVRTGKISTIYNVSMPYWMRLDQSAIGLHAGYVPGYPASAGCIRMPYDMARLVYDHTRSGTRVKVYSNWGGR